MSNRILIIEDDKEINQMLADFLSEKEFFVLQAFDGKEASELLKQQQYDLVLMDLMLPYKGGKDLIAELRQYSDAPVIVLSAKSMMDTRLEILQIGADDYILKPFDINEVYVRIQVMFRRLVKKDDSEKMEECLTCGELKYYLGEKRVTYKGQDIALTAKEFNLLVQLLRYPQKTFSKANLYETVWQEPYSFEDNTINVHVSNLRSKLKKATGNDYIATVWGIGYKLNVVADEQ